MRLQPGSVPWNETASGSFTEAFALTTLKHFGDRILSMLRKQSESLTVTTDNAIAALI